jgi:hypothetical protein
MNEALTCKKTGGTGAHHAKWNKLTLKESHIFSIFSLIYGQRERERESAKVQKNY